MGIERSAAAAPARPPRDTRLITLEHGEHLDSTLYRFEKGCRLRLCPGPSLLGRKVFLYTNYVITDDPEGLGEQPEFIRNQYYGLEWRAAAAEAPDADADADADADGEGEGLGAGALVTDADLYCEITLQRAGSFHYYFVYDIAESPVGPQGSGWFGVTPTLRGGVTPDGLACQTVLTKCLGPLPRWERTLRVARESGYNMVHFTPIQELGASGSSYSIANQLRVNPAFGADATFADVENIVSKMRTEWKMLSICDVVLNHTANETEWLAAHPEATYNCANCPHLRPAALLDALLARLTAAVERGDLEPRGVPTHVTAHEHIEAIREVLVTHLVPELRLHEMYTCDVGELVRQFYCAARNKVPVPAPAGAGAEGEPRDDLKLVQDPQYRRLRATVDLEAALRAYNVRDADAGAGAGAGAGAAEEARLARCCDALRRRLERLNEEAAGEVRDHLRAAVENACAGMRYHRVNAEGPRVRRVSARHPLVPRYFTWAALPERDADAEALVYGEPGALCCAHNGWVMGADPLEDFAARDRGGRVYLRRELVAWGDSVKLRYGARPEDSPFLWAHMRSYVELTAELFDGVRLDNCHSTPLHVAEYMLDCARNVRPDLYVLAELFTDSHHVDNIFVNRLGITSLVREAQSAWDAREAGRLVHRYGGRSVGAFLRPALRPAAPHTAHAMLLDLTHDNPSPVHTRCALDLVPCAALVAMACCASGSTRGYDELVPHHVHVVDERRLYPEWGDGEGEREREREGYVTADTGIVAAKRALNELHAELARDGYHEIYVDQVDEDVVAVTRHHPLTRKSVILVTFTAFKEPDAQTLGRRPVPPLRFEGALVDVALAVSVRRREEAPHRPHPDYVNGLRAYETRVQRDQPPAAVPAVAAVREDGAHTCVQWAELLPGDAVALRVTLRPEQAAAALALRRPLDALAAAPAADPYLVAAPLASLELADLHAALYRCEAEERDAGGGGSYEVPGWGALPYAGLQGVVSLLAEVTPRDELAHPLCDNLRAGDWLAEYTVARLAREPRLAALAARVDEALRPLRSLPRYLVPAHFAGTVLALHAACARAALARLGCARSGSLWRALALTSVQLTGVVPSAPLPPPSPALSPPPPARPVSLSAGLPHFAVGYVRCWGRDTFISLRGMFLLTGRHQEARMHILGFAACLRHGLIPNLLDGGRNARYNCRDAVWWWLHSIKQYVSEVPEGGALLGEPVSRLYPKEESEPQPAGAADQPLHDLMQEALDVHFQGLTFRERNAGRAIDAHMTDAGFNVTIGVDPETGFPFGGNDANAGTWMDKMGSSEAAGTRGKPATPRDGSAVELVALAYAVVAWLADRHRAPRHPYPYPGVVRRHRDATLTSWTWRQWADRIRAHFERHFWVPPAASALDARPDLVHRRAIYKDTHGASRAWADYQLRCNYPVAMAVAPALFDPQRAWRALDAVETLLLGPLGVKTLDPGDWAYRPDYDNSDDSADAAVAHGYNYHQGPEWTWPLFFYLRARLAFAHDCGKHARTVARAYAALGAPLREIRTSPWRGLPELTGAGGAPCRDACRTQAWSSAAALEALHDLRAARRARPLLAD